MTWASLLIGRNLMNLAMKSLFLGVLFPFACAGCGGHSDSSTIKDEAATPEEEAVTALRSLFSLTASPAKVSLSGTESLTLLERLFHQPKPCSASISSDST